MVLVRPLFRNTNIVTEDEDGIVDFAIRFINRIIKYEWPLESKILVLNAWLLFVDVIMCRIKHPNSALLIFY